MVRKTPGTFEEVVAHKRLLACGHSNKFYHKDRAAILLKSQNKRDELNAQKVKVVADDESDDEEDEYDAKVYSFKQNNKNHKIQFTQKTITAALKALEASGETINTNYYTHINMMSKLPSVIQNNGDFIKSLRNWQALISDIKNAKQTSKTKLGQPYEQATIKARLQAIVKMITIVPYMGQFISAEIKKHYLDDFSLQKTITTQNQKKKKEETKLMSFVNYLPILKEKYGEDRKEFVIGAIYSNTGIRDDLQLMAVRTVEETKDPKINYIVIPTEKKQQPFMILNHYKTSKKYGQGHKYEFTPYVSKVIRGYFEDTANHLQYGSYLLGDKKLTGYISNFNQKLTLPHPITINTYRKMFVGDNLDDNATPEDMHRLASTMLHSVGVQQSVYKYAKL